MHSLLLLALLAVEPGRAVTAAPLSKGKIDTCSELATIMSDETGTCGSVVMSTSPTITTPVITTSVEANTAGVASPNILTAAESGKTLTSEGAAALNYHTLPSAAAGLRFCFVSHAGATNGIRITAAAGDWIQLGYMTGSIAGYVQSTDSGARLCLEAINTSEWIADPSSGAWTLDGTQFWVGGDLYAAFVTLDEAVLTSSASGGIGHADGTTIIGGPGAGKRIQFVEGVIRYDHVNATYATCTGVNLFMQDESSNYIQVSDSPSNPFTNAGDVVVVMTHNDIAQATTGSSYSATFYNKPLKLRATGGACTNGASADGTATLMVYYRVVTN